MEMADTNRRVYLAKVHLPPLIMELRVDIRQVEQGLLAITLGQWSIAGTWTRELMEFPTLGDISNWLLRYQYRSKSGKRHLLQTLFGHGLDRVEPFAGTFVRDEEFRKKMIQAHASHLDHMSVARDEAENEELQTWLKHHFRASGFLTAFTNTSHIPPRVTEVEASNDHTDLGEYWNFLYTDWEISETLEAEDNAGTDVITTLAEVTPGGATEQDLVLFPEIDGNESNPQNQVEGTRCWGLCELGSIRCKCSEG